VRCDALIQGEDVFILGCALTTLTYCAYVTLRTSKNNLESAKQKESRGGGPKGVPDGINTPGGRTLGFEMRREGWRVGWEDSSLLALPLASLSRNLPFAITVTNSLTNNATAGTPVGAFI
jgi:hypothetical protein